MGKINDGKAKEIIRGLTAANSAETIARYVGEKLPGEIYPEGQFAGRGVVMVAGGLKYGVCAWVAIRALRHVGCSLPIEVWYRGAEERQPALEELTAAYGVTWIDAFAVRDTTHPHARLNGWECKPYAIQWSRFAEVLFVDADNVAVRDPSYLFDAPQYLADGTVLWPDYARMAPKREAWQVFGLADYADALKESERCVESGQILIDKRRAWPALCLANWLGERSLFYFAYVYGDKELFHLAWRRLQIPYAMPSRNIEPLRGTMCQHDFEGRRVFQHRNFGKWNLGENRRVPGFLLEDECLGWLAELKQLWDPGTSTFASTADLAAIAAHVGRRYDYVRRDKIERQLVLGPGGQFAAGGARCERQWTIRDGRLRICQQDGQLIMDLQPTAAGGWTGRWLLHEKMPVELRPVITQLSPAGQVN
jgi:hypothetical protein